MSERNDNRYVEDSFVGFAMYCDEHNLTIEEGRELAERIGVELEATAEDRGYYAETA